VPPESRRETGWSFCRMITYTAEWIVPVSSPPIRRGFVSVDGGRIAAVGEGAPSSAVDLGRVALLPALVNAHTHLELSHLHERVPPSGSFTEWVQAMMALRRQDADSASGEILSAAQNAIRMAHGTGTGVMGDVSNTLAIVGILREAPFAAHVFHELIGVNPPDPDEKVREARARVEALDGERGRARISLAPHAPYSVSPALFKAIRADVSANAPTITTVHLGESAAEIELLRHGTGDMKVMLERFGVWTDRWEIPRLSPVEYLSRLGFLGPDVLVVHGVQFDDGDLRRVRDAGATLVSCPRSNRYVGAGSPPLERFYESGVSVAFGTDSLASVENLNMFAELAEARRIAPLVPARALLRSATQIGASALGFGGHGSLEPGKRAAIIAVSVTQDPTDAADVEEYLVGGAVGAGDVEWIAQPT
jgi:cytosine/adenosine deaminase-related metal-dependent hydrolase